MRGRRRKRSVLGGRRMAPLAASIVLAVLVVGAIWGCEAIGQRGGGSPSAPPIAEPTSSPPASPDGSAPAEEGFTEITLAAVGDIMFHNTQLAGAYDDATGTYDFKPAFEDIRPLVSDADVAIANFETTTAGTSAFDYSGYPRFNSPDESLDAIRFAGFDVLSTANNHSLDTGKIGIVRTLEQIRDYGLEAVGTYASKPDSRVLLKDANGIRIAFLSYTEHVNGLDSLLTPDELDAMVNIVDKAKIAEDIRYADEQKADLIVASMHWGVEYAREPSDAQIELTEWLAEEGVDIVLGSHPHVIQRTERLGSGGGGTIVAYSMGNFLSNQRTETLDNPYTEDGVLLNFVIRKNHATGLTSVERIDSVPTWVYRYKETGKETYAYRILPLGSDAGVDIDAFPADAAASMRRSYEATMAQMEATIDGK